MNVQEMRIVCESLRPNRITFNSSQSLTPVVLLFRTSFKDFSSEYVQCIFNCQGLIVRSRRFIKSLWRSLTIR